MQQFQPRQPSFEFMWADLWLTFRLALERDMFGWRGYQANGYWIPGRWNFVGYRGPVVRFGYDHYDRGHDFDRHFAYERGHERFRR